jgi:hypothetical protein
VLAVVILLVWMAWLLLTLRTDRAQVDDMEIELARLALPFFGPFISSLMLAKLFRPKTVRDYWMIYLLGLVQMVLACVLAMTNKLDRDAPLFPLAVLAYLLTLIWTLRNFSLFSLFLAPAPRRMGAAAAPLFSAASQRARIGLATSLVWFVLATVVGLVLFFVIPRTGSNLGAAALTTYSPPAQTGFKPSVDLSGEGLTQISDELVFRAVVRDAVGAPTQLATVPRWRGVSCADYAGGRWRPFRKDLLATHPRQTPTPRPGELSIAYELDIRKVRQGGPVSTDDVPNRVIGEIPLFVLETYVVDAERDGRRTPLVFLDPNSTPGDRSSVNFLASRQERSASAQLMEHRPIRNVFYQQIIALNDVDRAEWTQPVAPDQQRAMAIYYQMLRGLPESLRSSGKLRTLAEDILKKENVSAEASNLVKAKALTRHLEWGGGFTYSLDRRRVDAALDPNEDFLLNVKEGSCERYASALALLLRALDIPSRLVIGFRGAEWNSVGQFYEIRELHAHTWVEAAVEVDAGNSAGGVSLVRSIHWLALDPTPQLESQIREKTLWQQNLSFARMLWEFFILDFSGDLQRQRFLNELNRLGWNRLEEMLSRFGALGMILIAATFLLSLVLAVLILRILQLSWRSYRQSARELSWLPNVPFYRRLIDLMLRRFRFKPAPTQTAREYAAGAASRLAESPQTRALESLPGEVAEHYYGVRFGGRSVGDANADLAPRLDQLARARS